MPAVAATGSGDFLAIEDERIVHLRTGKSDVARGAEALADGKHRITFKIENCGSPKGYGIVVGVSDADAPIWAEPAPVEGIILPKLQYGDKGFKPAKSKVAWGFCPGKSRFIASADGRSGPMTGASTMLQLELPPPGESIHTVVFEIDRPARSSIASRDFSLSTHPLSMPRQLPLHLEQLQKAHARDQIGSPVPASGQLSFGVNGGPMTRVAGVNLPSALYPWLMLSWEGDVVSYSVESTGPPVQSES